MGHIHSLHHRIDEGLTSLGKGVPGCDIGNVWSGHVVAVFTKAVTYSGALVSQAEQILERRAALGSSMLVTGHQRHIFQPVHHLISANGNGVKII